MRQNKSGKKNLAEYQKKYYQTHRKELLQRAKDYRLTHRDKVRELQRKLYQMGKTSALKICAECGKRFKPSSKMNTICSDKCRVKRWRKSQNKWYKDNPERRGMQYVAQVKKFYNNNPFAIYMPERKKAVEHSQKVHGYGIGKCKRCGAEFVKRTTGSELYCDICKPIVREKRYDMVKYNQPLTDRQVIALANFDTYKEVNELEKIDLDTLRGIPSEQKDAIIKALFEALKAEKESKMVQEATKPKERKMTQKGVFFAEVEKLQTGEYISLFELLARSGSSKNEYMKQMNIFNALKQMPDGVLDIQVCKIGAFPSGWLDTHLYKTHGGGRKIKE